MAGYSPKSLVDKLGIKEGRKALFISAPDDYANTLGKLPRLGLKLEATAAKALSKTISRKGPFDFIQVFSRDDAELETLFPALKALLAHDGMAWISWPKQVKAGRRAAPDPKSPSTLTEARVREIGLKTGLVDVKVCAVDETWSGLKFMFRVKDRP